MPEPVDLNFVTTDVLGGSVLQWADPFTDVKDLVDKAIAKLKPGECIRRLVIAGHGAEKTDGFFVFDPLTTGVETIDGGAKPIFGPRVASELARLKTHFCKDAVIEFRVCRFGIGKKGDQAMQAVADAAGVAVTAPMGEISSLAAIGGIATDWRVCYPKSWGLPSTTSFWRGGPTRPPAGAPSPSSIAPITGQVIPLRSIATPPAATTTTPIGKVSVVNPNPPPVNRATVAAAAIVAGALIVGWWFVNGMGPGTPTAQPTSTLSPTATPAPTSTPTFPPTPAPTQAPTPAPTPTTQVALLPPDGTYFGDGLFTSFDGSESYPTAWRLTKTGENVEIAQLLAPEGDQFQEAFGVADPRGVLVAVIDQPNLCEVLLVPADQGELSNLMFIAYGPVGMNCPPPIDVAGVYDQSRDDSSVFEDVIPEYFRWGKDVTVGLAQIPNWMVR